MKRWTIGTVAERSGVPASTIRYYEQIELLPPAERVNGRRRYDEAILETLGVIRLAQQAGFTLDEIKTLLHGFPADAPPSARWEAMAHDKLEELEERLQTIRRMKALLEHTLQCQCETLEACGAQVRENPEVDMGASVEVRSSRFNG